MGQCVQCTDFFPPHFMVEIEVDEDEILDPENPPQKCCYCYLDKKVVTMVNEETGVEEKISKEEAKKRYKLLLKKLYESRDIQKIINQSKGVPTIK